MKLSRPFLSNRSFLTAVVALLQIFGVGCSPMLGVKLDVPSSKASFRDRVKAYQKLRVRKVRYHPILSGAHHFRSRSGYWHVLVLGNGEEIYQPKSLLSAVSPDSETAKAIRAFHRASRNRNFALGLGIPLSILVPLGMVTGGLIASEPGNRSGFVTLVAVSGAVFVVGLIASATVGFVASSRVALYRRSILTTYDKDLQKRLHIQRPRRGPRAPLRLEVTPIE